MNPPQPRKVELFDTSLRDGMQQPNIDISVPNAVSLLQRMAAFGVTMPRSALPAPTSLWEI
jgi:isopropylmalate/homocitrate/citramalate synthase